MTDISLTDRRNAYKAFFLNSEAGKALVEQIYAVIDSNVGKAMDTNSLDHLSRAKGNREIVDLIDNVLKTEVPPKE